MVPHLHQLMKMKNENLDTFTVWLKPDGQAEPMEFLPGQFNMLYVFGIGEVPISISGNPEDRGELVHTIRAVGSVTHGLKRLPRGGQVGVRGPFGTSWPIQEAETKDVVLIAGGIGLAPLRPALYRIINQRKKYGKVVLLYGARMRKDLIFQKELASLQHRGDFDLDVIVDYADEKWNGNVGVVPSLISKAQFNPAHTVAMICGPEVMMRFTINELTKEGVHPSSIYLSMERNMKCGLGLCGRCQFMPHFICKDGPIFSYEQIRPFFGRKEV